MLNKVSTHIEPQVKSMQHAIWNATTKKEARKAVDPSGNTFAAKNEYAVNWLARDRDTLLTCFDFPGENCCHIRTTDPIESTFATY